MKNKINISNFSSYTDYWECAMHNLYLLTVILLILMISACSGSSSGGGSTGADPDPNFATTTYPDHDSFSLSVETFNPEGYGFDGLTSTITVRLADNLNDRTVVEGTEVFFSTEGGSIDSSCTVNANGECVVTWTSQDPRPSDGRAAILAWTTGIESFTDLNSSGFFDDGDLFPAGNDLSEPFRDDDHDGVRDDNEIFIDFDGDNLFDGPDGLYSGVNCSHSSLCSGNEFLYIFNSPVVGFGSTAIVMSGSGAYGYILNPDDTTTALDSNAIHFIVSDTQTAANVRVLLTDFLNNPLPAETELEATITHGDIELTPSIYSDTSTAQIFNLALTFTPPLAAGTVGTITITATTPQNIVSSVFVNFLVAAPAP